MYLIGGLYSAPCSGWSLVFCNDVGSGCSRGMGGVSYAVQQQQNYSSSVYLRFRDVVSLITPHAQRERGKVIGRGVHIYIYIYIQVKKKAFKINAKIEDVGLNED